MSFDFPNLPLHVITHQVSATSAGIWVGWFQDTNPPDNLVLSCISCSDGSRISTNIGSNWRSPFKGGSRIPRYSFKEVRGLSAETLYEVKVTVGSSNSLLGLSLFETLPTRLPNLPSRPFTVFIGSCFHHQYDGGRVGRSYQKLYNDPIYRPYIKFLVGDQVYIDQPWYGLQFRLSTALLKNHCIKKYENSWDGMRKLLGQGSNFFVSDDHEFYNDYPNPPLYIPILKNSGYRKTWNSITNSLFKRVQTTAPTAQFSIGNELSFFVLDTRIHRNQKQTLVSKESIRKLTNWVNTLIGPGVLVLNQPLIAQRKNEFWHERNLPDYSQYERIVRILSKSKSDLVILTGDVHFGRIARCKLGSGPFKLVEVISSPMSLVEDGYGTSGEIAKSIWKLGVDRTPEHFPSRSVSGVAYSKIEYMKAVRAKPRDKDRAAENFATVSFWRGEKPGTVLMRVQHWLPRRNLSREKLTRDFHYDETLYGSGSGHSTQVSLAG